MTLTLFLAVLLASAALEALWTFSVVFVSRRNIIGAVSLAGLMPLVSSQLTIVYVEQRLACIPFAVGSMIGMAAVLFATNRKPKSTSLVVDRLPLPPPVEPTKPSWWSRGGHA